MPAPPPAARTRASALPVEERRAAIVRAALPLFLEHGAAVTSREIAEAAGIAEGTIFRVFDDKEALIEAIVDAAYDTAPVERALDAIDPTLPIDQRLIRAVDILIRRSEAIFRVTSALATRRPSPGPGTGPETLPRRPPQLHALVRLLEPDTTRLATTPERAARLLRGLSWAASSRTFSEGAILTRAEIVDTFLHGILREPTSTPTQTKGPTQAPARTTSHSPKRGAAEC